MIRLRRDLLDAMVAHCRAEHPVEACGVLAGRGDVAWRHIPMRNAEASRTRYTMDPDEQLAVWRDMDERGEQPVVIYHSHTATEAVPSTPDVAYAAEPDAHYVIVSTRGELPSVRSYRIADGVVTEGLIEVLTATGHFFVGRDGQQEPQPGVDRVTWDNGATIAVRGGPCLDGCDGSYWAYVQVDGKPRQPGLPLPSGEGNWQCWMELDFVGQPQHSHLQIAMNGA